MTDCKRFLREKSENYIGIINLCLKMVLKKCIAWQQYCFGLCHSMLLDIGQDHQEYPTVHSGGVSRGVGISDM